MSADPDSPGRVATRDLLLLRESATPLQRRVGVVFRRAAVAAVAVAVVLWAVGVASGAPWTLAAVGAMTFALAAIPFGVPFLVTLALSRAVSRLARLGATLRRVGAVETLGSTTLVCVGDLAASKRSGVATAVDDCRRAGIGVIVVSTGDEATTRAALEVMGFPSEETTLVTGDDLVALREDELPSRVRDAAGFARMSPSQRFAVVDAMQRAGAVVALTGDGVDDGPALRRADVSLVSRSSAEAVRVTTDVVLPDHDLALVAAMIREGRHVAQSIERALLYLLAFHLPIVALALVAPVAGVPLVLQPLHVVWLGLLAYLVAANVFVAEAASDNVMIGPQRDASAALLPGAALLRSAVTGGVLAVGAWVAYAGQLVAVGEAEARALALIALVSGNQVLMFAERLALPGLGVPLVPRVRAFWVAWCASALSLGLVLYVPPIARLFTVEPPPAVPTLAALAVGALGVGWRLVAAPAQSPPARAAR